MFSLAHELSTLILLNSKTHKFFLVSSILVLCLKPVVFVSIYLDLLCGWINKHSKYCGKEFLRSLNITWKVLYMSISQNPASFIFWIVHDLLIFCLFHLSVTQRSVLNSLLTVDFILTLYVLNLPTEAVQVLEYSTFLINPSCYYPMSTLFYH